MAIPFAELTKINPSSIIELFELELTVGKHIATGNPQNLPTTYRFHAGANLNSFGEVVFQSNSSTITEWEVNNIMNEIIEKALSIPSVEIPGLKR